MISGRKSNFIGRWAAIPPGEVGGTTLIILLELGLDYYDLLVIDTLMTFLPSSQNNPMRLRRWFNELRVVAGYPAGILILHQACTARSRAGPAASRGPLQIF